MAAAASYAKRVCQTGDAGAAKSSEDVSETPRIDARRRPLPPSSGKNRAVFQPHSVCTF